MGKGFCVEEFMASSPEQVTGRLEKLGLKTDDLPLDRLCSGIAALCCFPMYMVANVHAWTSERQFHVPLFDLPGSEKMRESFVIGEQEGAFEISKPHSRILSSMIATARPPDRVIYEYALDTLSEFLELASPQLGESIRTAVARMVVAVAEASGKGLLGSGAKVSPEERECIDQIAEALDLKQSGEAARALESLG
jgi:hypothetical protein